jgi:carboxypeptidase family protein
MKRTESTILFGGAEMNSVQVMSSKSLRAKAARAMQALCLCIGVFLVCVPLFSQGSQGRILGTITDQTGGVVSNATVTVVDVERGVSRTLTTGDSGEFSAPNLLPGTYTVRAEAKGFKIVERQKIVLEVGKEIRVDLTLQPGAQEQTITITEALPLVETSNATLGGTLSNQTINDLPLNGRNYINLLTLRPGMTVYPGGGGSTRSANGTRTEDIGYLLDGVREDDPYTGSSVLNAAIAAGDSSTSLPIDAIQEFNTEQNPKSEYGWKPGAIVNAGVKSGSNTIHGTAFAFGRTTSLDASNFFDVPPAKAPVALEQFGASLGGPIKKDKLFYFVNYEGQRYSVGSTLITTSPVTCAGGSPGCALTKTDASQSLVDACNSVTFAKVAPLSAQIAGLNPDCSIKPPNYTPGASESLFPTNTSPNGVVIGMVSTNSQNNGVVKIDYHINDHHSLSGMYFNGRGGGLWNDAANQVGVAGSGNSPFMSDLFGYIQVGSGAWTWTPNSTVVNELRVGYSHFRQWYDSIDSHVNPLAYGINTGVTDPRFFGFPLLRINPFSLTNFRLGGNWPKHTGPDGSLQFMDHVSVLHGNHAFKFGGEIISNAAQPFITANGKGSIRFSNLRNFLLGNVKNSGTLSAILVGDPLRHLSNQQYAAFLQDDWRVRPRLTVNFGLRYELTTVLKDRDSKLGNFDPGSPTGLVQVGNGETSAFHGDHKNFSPRFGFAWDVRGNGKTVIRGGGSIIYEQLPFSVFIAVGNQLGLNQVPTGASLVVNGATRPGSGNMGVLSIDVPGGTSNSTGTPTGQWKAQTPACVTGGTTACGPIFPTALVCGDGLVVTTDPFPCNSEAVDPNLRNPYVSTWTLTFQRAITNNLSLEVAYVGNHGTKFLGFQNINQPPLGSGYSAAELAGCANGTLTGGACDPQDTPSKKLEQMARPFTLNNKFPYLGQIDRLSNLDHSNYNGLHVTLTQRPSHALSFLAGYTYGHALDNASANFNANQLPPDSSHPAALYGNSDFDIRHRFTFSTTYALPGRKSPGQLLEGWQLNSVVTLQTGAPWTPQDPSNDFSGTGQIKELNTYGQIWNFSGNRADFTSGPSAIPCWSGGGGGGAVLADCAVGAGPEAKTLQLSAPPACAAAANTPALQATLNAIGCFFKGNSALTPPALGTIGNSGRNIFRDSGFKNWDVSVIKDLKFKERLTTQFRAEFFNVLNHPNFTDPNGPAGAGFNDPSGGGKGFGCGCNTPDQASPNPVLGTGANRSIQLGLKLIW